MIGIKQIKVDGTTVDLERRQLTLKDAQDLVATGMKHALIELVPLPRQDPYEVGGQIMFVNEEGLIHDMEVNEAATALARRGPLVGDVIIVENEASDF